MGCAARLLLLPLKILWNQPDREMEMATLKSDFGCQEGLVLSNSTVFATNLVWHMYLSMCFFSIKYTTSCIAFISCIKKLEYEEKRRHKDLIEKVHLHLLGGALNFAPTPHQFIARGEREQKGIKKWHLLPARAKGEENLHFLSSKPLGRLRSSTTKRLWNNWHNYFVS